MHSSIFNIFMISFKLYNLGDQKISKFSDITLPVVWYVTSSCRKKRQSTSSWSIGGVKNSRSTVTFLSSYTVYICHNTNLKKYNQQTMIMSLDQKIFVHYTLFKTLFASPQMKFISSIFCIFRLISLYYKLQTAYKKYCWQLSVFEYWFGGRIGAF